MKTKTLGSFANSLGFLTLFNSYSTNIYRLTHLDAKMTSQTLSDFGEEPYAFFLFSFFRFKGRGNVRFRLSQHLRIQLFIAGEPQKLDRLKHISLESSFHKLFKKYNFQRP